MAVDDPSTARTAGEHEASLSPIVELRQYVLHPGARDTLTRLFDREFVESQEALGIALIGQFRDVDDPDRFVWIRGFPDMALRLEALRGFYEGPVWAAHREAANATMLNSDDVLLLRPANAASGFTPSSNDRPPPGVNGNGAGLVVATIHALDSPASDGFAEYFEHKLKPALIEAGVAVLAYFVTEMSVNDYPRLPVRERENVFTWFAGFPDRSGVDRAIPGHGAVERLIGGAPSLRWPPHVLRLIPTARSLLTGLSQPCAAMSSRRRGASA